MIVTIIIFIVIYTILDATRDETISYDNVKDWSFIPNNLRYFFSKEAQEAPKPTFFMKYFPMFHDAWHQAKFWQYCDISTIIGLLTGSWLIGIGTLLLMCGIFNLTFTNKKI